MKVVIIARNPKYDSEIGSINIEHPPIGAKGYLISAIDEYGEYDIEFPEYPCPVPPTGWVIHKSMIAFIDDKKQKARSEEMALADNTL